MCICSLLNHLGLQQFQHHYPISSCNQVSGVDVHLACDSYTWIDGNSYNSNNDTIMFTITGGDMCGTDSLVRLDLTIYDSQNPIDAHEACSSFTWIDGNTYVSSNNTATYSLPDGCLITLDLVIANLSMGSDVQIACYEYTWIDGNTYMSSNNSATHNIIGGAINGCDSLVTLDLTILNSAVGIDTQTACNAYTWIDGNTYTSSNNSATYNIIGGAVNGCDSLVTLNLTILFSNDVGPVVK